MDWKGKRVRWRADSDKIGFAHVTPLTDAALNALDAMRSTQAAIGDARVFPAPGDPTAPCSRHLMRD